MAQQQTITGIRALTSKTWYPQPPVEWGRAGGAVATIAVGTATGDNATGYNASNTWKHNSDTGYLQFSADNASVFWFNQSSTEADRESNSVWIFKFTKQ